MGIKNQVTNGKLGEKLPMILSKLWVFLSLNYILRDLLNEGKGRKSDGNPQVLVGDFGCMQNFRFSGLTGHSESASANTRPY